MFWYIISPDAVNPLKEGETFVVKKHSTANSLSSVAPDKSKFVFQRAQEIHKHVAEVKESREKQQTQRRKSYFSDAKSEEEELAERVGHKHWRVCLLKFLQGHVFQHVLTILLVLDIVIVLAELFVEAEYPSCHKISYDGISCCPSTGARQLLPGGPSTDDHFCTPPLAAIKDAGCDDHKYPEVHVMHSVAFAASATILCIFEVELLALLCALGMPFFKNPLYILDIVVVTASLVLDFHLHLGTAVTGESSATILIVARCWRFVRIMHGAMVSSHERDMEKLKETLELAKELEEDSKELMKEVEDLDNQVNELVSAVCPPLPGP